MDLSVLATKCIISLSLSSAMRIYFTSTNHVFYTCDTVEEPTGFLITFAENAPTRWIAVGVVGKALELAEFTGMLMEYGE